MVELLQARVTSPALRDELAAIGFSVFEIRAPSELFVLVTEAPGCVTGSGAYVVREHPTIDAVIEVPHVGFEQETLSEGYRAFQSGARALAIAGSHRCVAQVESPCRGAASGVCGGDPPGYRISDVAAFDQTDFQAFHEAVVATLATTVVVSLHGKAPQPGVPTVVVSDGTRTEAPPAALSRQVAARLITSGITAGSCQDPGSTLRLCGTSSVQGRASNGATDACGDVPATASGRFLHVEQDYDKIITTLEPPMLDVLRGALPALSIE